MSKRAAFLIVPIAASLTLIFIFTGSQDCSDGWYITGYYTPFEDDFTGELEQIKIDGHEFEFDKDFLQTVKIEGWGKTKSNQFVGWYDSEFHINDFATDVEGNELLVPMIAADANILEYGTKIRIPTLPEPWNEKQLLVSDVGPAIIGKHIDVYVGEGDEARIETERITSYENTLCVVK